MNRCCPFRSSPQNDQAVCWFRTFVFPSYPGWALVGSSDFWCCVLHHLLEMRITDQCNKITVFLSWGNNFFSIAWIQFSAHRLHIIIYILRKEKATSKATRLKMHGTVFLWLWMDPLESEPTKAQHSSPCSLMLGYIGCPIKCSSIENVYFTFKCLLQI